MTTKRLTIRILSDEEMRALISREQDEEMKAAYTQMLEGSVRFPEPGNAASQRVLEKAGFLPNGIMGEEGPRFVWQQGRM